MTDGFIETICGKKYFISNTSVIDHSLNFFFKLLYFSCNNSILIVADFHNSVLKMVFRDAASKCCEYGLVLVSLDTPNELECLCNGSLGDYFVEIEAHLLSENSEFSPK